jgi:hypothetical protein
MNKFEIQRIMFDQIIEILESGFRSFSKPDDELAEVIDLDFERWKRASKS